MNRHDGPTEPRSAETRRRLLSVLLTYSPAVAVTLIFLTAPRPLSAHRLALMAFVLGLVGIIIMVRKESPTVLGSVRGRWAAAQGILITVAFWLAAFYFMLSSS